MSGFMERIIIMLLALVAVLALAAALADRSDQSFRDVVTTETSAP